MAHSKINTSLPTHLVYLACGAKFLKSTIMPCLHVVCSKCLGPNNRVQCPVQCPVCNDLSPALLPDVPLDLSAQLYDDDDGNIRCTCCHRELREKDVTQCYTCDDIICETCHSSFFNHHEV